MPREEKADAGDVTGPKVPLTRHENVVLAAVQRYQPATAYRIKRHFASSVTGRFSTSAGGVYSIIRRLLDAGLISSEAVDGSPRGAGLLTMSPTGTRAVRAWITSIGPEDLILEDPVRTKLSVADTLDPEELGDWLRKLHAALTREIAELARYASTHAHFANQFDVHDNARCVLVARLEWVRRTLLTHDLPDPSLQTTPEDG